ncbi:MAG: hypothetical protein E7E23_24195, partial [Paenibacillus sp.]|nr:hypothetical protein [Paenibacillus sp.]
MKQLTGILKYLAVIAVSLLALIPFYVLLYLGLNTPSGNVFEGGALPLPDFYFGNFREAWIASQLGTAIGNSLIITAGALLIMVAVSSAAAYSIARFKSKMNALIFNTLLIRMMVPAIIIT